MLQLRMCAPTAANKKEKAHTAAAHTEQLAVAASTRHNLLNLNPFIKSHAHIPSLEQKTHVHKMTYAIYSSI